MWISLISFVVFFFSYNAPSYNFQAEVQAEVASGGCDEQKNSFCSSSENVDFVDDGSFIYKANCWNSSCLKVVNAIIRIIHLSVIEK